MDHFSYRNRVLHCEDVPVPALARAYGTPLYVYSKRTLLHHLHQLQRAFAAVEPLICYSVKTNGNLSICRLMAENGAGFDVTSGGELYRALKAGGTGEKIVFAGVGKTDLELRYGLDNGVHMFNVESEEELRRLPRSRKKPIRLPTWRCASIRPCRPRRTSKPIPASRAPSSASTSTAFWKWPSASPAISDVHIIGLHMHLGSPIITTQPYREGIEKGVSLIQRLRQQGHKIEYLNMGGGFGIHYRKKEAPPADAFAEVIVPAVKAVRCKLILEPGRFIVGNAGILVSRVIYTKESGGKQFVIQDAGMNDLIRPTLYESFHRIWPVEPAATLPAPPEDYEADIPGTIKQDVVGPVCESGDFLAKDRQLPPMQRGELLATFSAGAYGMSMSSNYNSRPRAAEVLVDGDGHRLIRRRETYADLVRAEVEMSGE